jgi:hypothetical protein
MRFWRLSVAVLVVGFALGVALAVFHPATARAEIPCRQDCFDWWCVDAGNLCAPDHLRLYVGYAHGNDFDCSGPFDCGVQNFCTTQARCAENYPSDP